MKTAEGFTRIFPNNIYGSDQVALATELATFNFLNFQYTKYIIVFYEKNIFYERNMLNDAIHAL